MNNQQTIQRKYAIAALGGLLALLVLAVLYYRERLLFADTAYMVFNVVNTKDLATQHQRYGSFITQLVPLAGQAMHLPLKVIMFAYSICFNVLYVLVGCLLVFGFRKYSLAILFTLYFFLFVSESFFLPVAEVHQAVMWLFLMFGAIIYMKEKNFSVWLIAIPFIVFGLLSVTTHFIVIIPAVFLWVYLILDKTNWPFSLKETLLLTLLFALIIYVKMAIAKHDAYDDDNLKGLMSLTWKDICDTFTTPTINIFFLRCQTNYWIAPIILLIGIMALIARKKFLLSLWTLLSITGYIILMGITYKQRDANMALFHVETEWLCLGILAAAPFVFNFLPYCKPGWLGIGILIFIFAVRLSYISSSYTAFHWRLKFEERVLTQMKAKNITKLAMIDAHPLMDSTIQYWAMPFETMMISAVNGERPQRTCMFINGDDHDLMRGLEHTTGFWNVYAVVHPRDMNQEYFTIDTTQTYKVMEVKDFFK